MTTPPCTEGIIWTIFRTQINISENQVRFWYFEFIYRIQSNRTKIIIFFIKMESFHKNLIKFNDRDVQNLNKRTLYVSVQLSNERYSSLTLILIIFFMGVSVFELHSKFFRTKIVNFYNEFDRKNK